MAVKRRQASRSNPPVRRRRRASRKTKKFTVKMQKKLLVFFGLICVAFIGLVFRLISITRNNGTEYSMAVLSQQSYENQTLPYKRGKITDANGTILADSTMVYNVIIDSKVSLNAYKEYMVSETVEARRRYAKAHVESVRKHVDELKTKDYASYIPEGRRKVNYNLMFIPVEGAFRLMLEEDPLLWQVAKDNNVLIVSQMKLVIVLNMIQMAWKQANQEKNIAEVYKTAEELMSQLSGWMASYVKIGESLEKARGAYGDATKKLTESNQSVIKKIQKLEKLGLSPKKSQGRIKTSGRILGQESIIPQTLSSSEDAIEYDE